MKKGMLFFVFMLFFVIFISSVYAVSYGGEPCSYGRDCFISSDSQDYSVCLHGVCLLYSDGAYVECRINSHCGLDGLKVCKNYKCVLNQFCTRDSDCSSGYVCDSFVCKLSYDKSCSSDLECVSSLICDSASKKCRVGLNGYCNSTKKCAYPHFCENNKCITKSFGPGTCAKDSDCNSTSVCLNNKCVISANRTNFGSCKASENCAVNNYCINGLCSLNCASLGSSCGSSGKCSTQNFDNHSFISDGVVVYGPYYGSLCVQNKGVLNSVCSTNNDCSSGYVCDSFVCKLDKEQQCKSKSDCYFSYYCLQGVCVDLGFDAKVSNVSFVSGSEFENKNFVFKNGKTTVYVLASVVSDPVLNLNRFNISGVLSTNSVNSIGFGSFYSTDAFGDAIYSVNLDLSDDVLNSDKILFSAKKGDIVLYDASPISFTIGCSSDGDCSQFQNKPFCGSQEVCVQCKISSNCKSNEECVAGLCVLKVSSGGVPCTKDSDCRSGYVCDSSICKLSYDKSCSSNSECMSSLVCDSASKKCRVGFDGYCNSTKRCDYPYFCENNKCITKSFEPGTCAKDSDCNSTSVCLNNKCVIHADRKYLEYCKVNKNCQKTFSGYGAFYCFDNLCNIVCQFTKSCPNSDLCTEKLNMKYTFINTENKFVESSSSGYVCVKSVSDSNKGGSATGGSGGGSSSSTVYCSGLICSSNKECYWNSSSLGLSKSDFYVTEGIYCCAPWKNKGVSKDSGNAVCVGSAINPVTGGTSSLIEGACVDPDSDGIGTREDLMCPLGKVGSDCQKLAAVVCKIPPADLSVALSFYGFFSFMLTLLILVSFYIVKRKL